MMPYLIKGEVPGLPVTANQIDDNVWMLDSLADGILITEVVGQEKHLSKVSHQLQAENIVVVTSVWDDYLCVEDEGKGGCPVIGSWLVMAFEQIYFI